MGISGFTLIEVLIVVAVIAILAAIATPSYRAYVLRTHRAAAKACLARLSGYMERYHAANLRYDQDTNAVKIAWPDLDCTAQTSSYQFGFAPKGGSFAGLTVPNPNPGPAAYVLQAVPQKAQAQDTPCGTLALDQTGAQAISGTGSAQTCWQR